MGHIQDHIAQFTGVGQGSVNDRLHALYATDDFARDYFAARWRRFRTGQNFYYPMSQWQLVSAVATAATDDQLTLMPALVGERTTFDRIGIHVVTGDPGATIAFCIYDDSGEAYPGSLILETATQPAATSDTFVEATINETLEPGLYWIGFIANGVPQVRSGGNVWSPLVGRTDPKGTNGANWAKASQVAGSLPDPFDGTSVGTTAFVVMMRVP